MIMTWVLLSAKQNSPFKPPRSPRGTGKSDPFFCKTAQKIYSYDSVRMMRSRPVAKA